MPAFDETTSRRRRSNKDATGVGGGLGGDARQQRRNNNSASFQQSLSSQYSQRVTLQQQQQLQDESNIAPRIVGQLSLACRMAFVPGASDLYGVINCSPLLDYLSSQYRPQQPTDTADTADDAPSKLGPTLLEIRRLDYNTNRQSTSMSTSSFPQHGNDDYNTNSYHHEKTVLVSKGMVGLGNSVSSTCLDFCPNYTTAAATANLPLGTLIRNI